MLSAPEDNPHISPATARESTPRANLRCGVLESAWSPDAQKSPRGVHRRPNHRTLSLFGVKPGDPRATAVAVAILLSAALIAGYLPARKASRIDPMTAVRHE